jgi:hypothetical protein
LALVHAEIDPLDERVLNASAFKQKRCPHVIGANPSSWIEAVRGGRELHPAKAKTRPRPRFEH